MRAIQDLSKVVQRLQAVRLAKIEASLPAHFTLPEGWVPDGSTFGPGAMIPVCYSRLA